MSSHEDLARYLKIHHYGVTPDDLEITDTRGFWRFKARCPGGENCRHAFRGHTVACEGGGQITLYIYQSGRDHNGRFLRPYRLWEAEKVRVAASLQAANNAGIDGR
jgi:hypothetical protein